MTNRSSIHPGAWWLFGAGAVVGLTGVANPLVDLLALTVLFVVVLRHSHGAVARTPFATSLKIGAILIVVRAVFSVLFGARTGGTVLLNLPQVPLPSFLAGVSIGGPVTTELLLQAFCQGLALATVLACFGACSTLAPPGTLLDSLPKAVYELGLSVAIALAFLPELVASAQALKAARRLRGRPTKGIAGLRGTVVPVLEGALERSVTLAASMDARGFGLATATPRSQHLGTVVAGLGTALLGVGIAGLLTGGSLVLWSFLSVVLGSCLLALAISRRSHQLRRTTFAHRPFTRRSIVVGASGVTCGLLLLEAGRLVPGLMSSPVGRGWPTLSPLVVVALAFLLLGGWSAPEAVE